MDPVTQMTNMVLAERTRRESQQQQTPPITPDDAAPPPPYTDSDSGSESDDEVEPESPLSLTINAAHSIQGCNNLVPTSPTPLADATKFSTILLHAIKQLNNAAEPSPSGRRRLKVDLTINCGITVVGHRNVIGSVGLKPKAAAAVVAGPGAATGSNNTVAGAKRKADDDTDEIQERKKAAVEGASR
ncbi:hypothetical protein LTR37_011250 [Vermiconidia calcicola]|uniref:Uncharacterized protein n=1 Tax=Vermiconidia calcicola TaxID=1690605 RepID=A0ACC3N2S8_9PEZI|nr:hypothetical protein LTR37_011250 [Vermiconidia calcicola]